MNEHFNPKMLTVARDARGHSQTELAELTGISQGYISKLEHGLADPSPNQLETLARALEFPRPFFSRTDDIYGPGVGCHYRRRKSISVGKLRELQARMNIARIRFESLLRGVEIDNPREFARMDIEDYEDAAEVAQMLRQMWHVPYGPVDNLTDLIESAGGMLMCESFGTDLVDEMSQWFTGHPFFYLNAETPADRYRWSLAHGLGHVVMHSVPGTSKAMEDEADQFAGEFLAPAAEIGPDLENLTLPKLAHLKMQWKISMQAVVMRAFHLGTITDRQRRSFFTRLSQLGYRKQEPYPLDPEEPAMFRRLLEFHRTEHDYSVGELAKVIAIYPTHLQSIYLKDGEDSETKRLRIVN